MRTFQKYALSFALIFCGLASLCLSGCTKTEAGLPKKGAKTTAVSADEQQGASASIGTPSESANAVSVQTVRPQQRDLVSQFEQPGIVEAAAQADLFSRVSGYIKVVNVDIGDTVKAGQVLLEVDVPELEQELAYKDAMVEQAEAELTQAETTVTVAQGTLDTHASQLQLAEADKKKAAADRNFRKSEYERYAGLAADNASTKQLAAEKEFGYLSSVSAYESAVAKLHAVEMDAVILKAKLAGANADVKTKKAKVSVAIADREKSRVLAEYAKLKAPYDGTITRRNVDPGEYVHSPSNDKATPPFTIARTDYVTVVMRVPEPEVPRVRVGNVVQMRFQAHQAERMTGKVTRIAKSLEDKSRTMRIEIDVKNPDDKLYPGMFGNVSLVLSDVKNALTVPATALYGTGNALYVVTVRDNVARRVAVKTGYDDGRVVQIVSGLSGNETIVVSNKGDLADGQRVIAARVDEG